MSRNPKETMWTTIDNYDHMSRNPFCSVTGLPKLPGEIKVFRLAEIEFEGSFDIGEQCVKDMAAELGYVSPEKFEELCDLNDVYEQAINSAKTEIERLEGQLRSLKDQNYELIAELQEYE